jgi:phosphate-selective porin OprO/OprP
MRQLVMLGLFIAGSAMVSGAEYAIQAKSSSETPSGVSIQQANDEHQAASGLEHKESLSTVELAGGDYRVKLGTVIQADGRFFPDDRQGLGVDSFYLRRAIIVVRGSIRSYADFVIEPNLGMGKAALNDMRLDFRLSNACRLRIGRTKVPVSLEFLQPNRMLLLLEHSLPTKLAPGRDQGVMLHGAPWKGRLTFALGAFNGTVDGASADGDTDDDKEIVMRLLAQPLAPSKKSLFSGLALGLSASFEKQHGGLPTYKSAGQLSFFSYVKDAAADGRHDRLAPQGMFHAGPFGFQAEYVRSEQEIVRNETRKRLANRAWSAIASVVLLGGAAGFDNVKIAHPFEPGSGYWGALQIAARLEGFDADNDAFVLGFADLRQSARRARGLGLGLHWYLSQSLRCSIAFSRTRFSGGSESGDRHAENAVQLRSQVVF